MVFFIHFVATMDDWDPALINPLAEKYPILLLDNKGVGGSCQGNRRLFEIIVPSK